ncbi:MAG: hypothetical protein JXB15_00570, partial [Anaerolineales bacterium]|nr:hypothetical protein [Anaerolineales bacterium]
VVNGVTTVYIGSHYEYSLSSSTAKKYYYVGSSRIAMRDDASSLYWLLSDHLGSTMKSVKASDSTTSERRYRAWGEARFTNGTTPTNYRYTGQRGIISSLSR